MNEDKKVKMPYMTGLDGLRAIAVLSVIAYHLHLPYTTGGFLGVAIFFVISGYLITSLLLFEWEQKQTINLGNFWLRRAKRLLPAIFFLLLILNIVVPLLKPELVSNLHKESIAALFFYSNWHYIFRDISYFESFEMTSFLMHFWSLAIEEQYYLICAFVIFILLKNKVKMKILLFIFIGSALLSAIVMGVLFQPNQDPSRIYYGTDTRLFSLLIGSSFAIIFPNYRLKENLTKMGKIVFNVISLIGVFSLFYLMIITNEYESFVYQGGMVILSLITCIVVLSLALPVPLFINKIMSMKPLQWIGVRSYGIYLWHYPIIQWFNVKTDTSDLSVGKILLEIALIFVIATLSYELVEKPIRYGTFRLDVKRIGTSLISVCLLFVILNDFSNQKLLVNTQPTNGVVETTNSETITVKTDEKETISTDANITAIGDSVLINPTHHLKKKIPSIYIDAKIGRQMWDIVPILEDLKKQNQLSQIVLLVAGSNGLPTEDYFDQIMETIGNKRMVYFVNTRVPKPWENEVNKLLVKKSKEYKNMRVIDWYSASANHNEYFLSDGVHTSETIGALIYANLIANSIMKEK